MNDTIKKTINKILCASIPVNRVTKPLFKIIYLVHYFTAELLRFTFKTIYYDPLFRSQCERVGKHLRMEELPYIVGNGSICIGDSVRLSGKPGIGFSNKIVKTPKLIIGDKTFIGHGTSFAIADKIEIGKNCLIAGNVSIMDNDGHPLDYIKRRNNLPPDRESVKPVIIGNDVWIGRGAVIAKGVVIEDRAIIGAHAVVTKRVIADTVVAGNPAAVVKSIKAL